MATKVERSSDCGNSPKQKLLEDVSVALATGDTKTIEKLTLPELTWHQVGKAPVEGRDAVFKQLSKAGAATELVIEKVVSHGRSGAVSGVEVSKGKRKAFCHMFDFNNTKCTHVKSIATYAVALRRT